MNEDHPDENDESKSKSQLKREMHALRDLGKELVSLSPARLEKIPLTEKIVTAVVAARRFKRGALVRQLQYIARLLHEEGDEQAIIKALDTASQPHRQQVQHMHQAEQWRDNLLTAEQKIFDDLLATYPQCDRQYLRQLIRNAAKERAQNKPAKSARLLYQYLFELIGSHDA